MKFVVAITFVMCALCITHAYSQIGRHEEPIDTISMGGAEQDRQTMQMERHDELHSTLLTLRDSVKTLMRSDHRDHTSNSSAKLAEQRAKIDKLIKGFDATERDESLMRKAEIVIQETRRRLREVTKD